MSNSFKNTAITRALPETNSTLTQTVKTTLCSILMFIGGALSSPAQTNTWVQKSDVGHSASNFPEPPACNQAVGFSIGSKGYIGTGFNDKGLHSTNSFWEYDPAAGTWTQKADFGGTARIKAVGFNIGTKGYIGTGDAGNYPSFSKDFWEYDPVANTWTRKADLGGTSRESAVGFSIGSKGYIGTGLVRDINGGAHYLKDLWEYDPGTDIWTKKADFGGTARDGAVGFSIGSKGYVGTGGVDIYDGNKDFWEYDPAADAWTKKADFGGSFRYNAVGFSMGGKGYIGTGYGDSYTVTNDFWQFDPVTNTWTKKEVFGGPGRYVAVGFSIGNKGYIGTGTDGNGFIRKDFWEYDLVSDSWTQKKDFGESIRKFAVSFSIGNKGYIGTGSDGGRLPPFSKKDFWEYDLLTNAWTQKADFGGTERESAVGFSIGSKGYIGMGYDADHYNFLSDFWEYDPVANTWTQKADFGGNGRTNAVGLSIGSKGYIGMGKDVFLNFYKDFREYDPATDTWTQKADFGGDGRTNAVGFSIGSKGYVGTGSVYFNYYKDFWEYNPATDRWTQKTDFGGNAREAAAGFSISSKGYIGTGDDGDYNYYKDFWEYDPSADTWVQKADFGGNARHAAVGFSIGSKGYIGTGEVYFEDLQKDFWEYTPEDVCPAPVNLRVPKISNTAAVLIWKLPAGSISGFKIRYRAVGDDTVMKRYKTGSGNHVILKGLLPNTTYEWQVRSNCATNTTDWVCGPDFTTLSSTVFSSDISTINGSKVKGNISVQIMPNPNKGNFTVQMHLSDKAIPTTLSLYNSIGEKIWQQNAGKLNGSVNVNIALENKLPAGMYVLIIQQGDTRLMQKVVVSK